MDKKSKEKFEISEMFMAKADVHRCHFGIIKRLRDAEGNPFVFSRILMPDGFLCASAPEQIELGDNLDIICKMSLDEGLHSNAGVSTEIFGSKYFLN